MINPRRVLQTLSRGYCVFVLACVRVALHVAFTKVTRPVATSPAQSTSDRVSPIPWKPVLRVPNRLVVPNVSVVLPFFRQCSLLRFPVAGRRPRGTASVPRTASPARRVYSATALSRVIYASTINQVDRRNSYGFVHRLTRAPRRGGDSPVRGVVREVLPGRELAPRADVRSGRVGDPRYAVPYAVAREPVARGGQDIVTFRRRPRL